MAYPIISTAWARVTRRPVRRKQLRRVSDAEGEAVELDTAEMAAVIDALAKTLLDLDSATFKRHLEAGKLDRQDWRVEYLIDLIE